jgi:hypothetical protein
LLWSGSALAFDEESVRATCKLGALKQGLLGDDLDYAVKECVRGEVVLQLGGWHLNRVGEGDRYFHTLQECLAARGWTTPPSGACINN